jgi:hypothetical protein
MKEKNNNNKKRSKHNMSPKLCLGDIINALDVQTTFGIFKMATVAMETVKMLNN